MRAEPVEHKASPAIVIGSAIAASGAVTILAGSICGRHPGIIRIRASSWVIKTVVGADAMHDEAQGDRNAFLGCGWISGFSLSIGGCDTAKPPITRQSVSMDFPSHVILAQAPGYAERCVMEQAGFSAEETIRLACLTQYDILDTPAEQGFDDIVLLASRICEAPVAIVSLVAEDRQWFKARIGFDPPQTPRSQSVCAHGLHTPGLLVIPDLTADPRTHENTLVTAEPFIRFYAGARLEAPNGMAIGMLCVIDTTPRPGGLRPEQASSLEALARQVMSQLELRRAIGERELLVQEAHHRVKNSLQMVQSLLSLQARMTEYPEAARQLRESATRVNAFGAIHEHLYQVGAAVEINLRPYLGGLADSQNEALVSAMDGRDIAFNADSAVWPAADAPTVGLILMELVTNALKYGAGVITVTLRSVADEIVLSVEDEGTSLPEDFVPSQGKGLGMRVLTGLLNGRRGRLSIDRTRGHTCFVATLKRPDSKN